MKRREVIGGIWKLAVVGSVLNKKLFPFDADARDGFRAILQNETYIRRGNFYKQIFTEPVESVLFLFTNGEFFIFTSMDQNAIYGELNIIIDYLEKKKKDVKDLILVIHNHLNLGSFSSTDTKTYYRLRENGFTGKYLLYTPGGGVRKFKE